MPQNGGTPNDRKKMHGRQLGTPSPWTPTKKRRPESDGRWTAVSLVVSRVDVLQLTPGNSWVFGDMACKNSKEQICQLMTHDQHKSNGMPFIRSIDLVETASSREIQHRRHIGKPLLCRCKALLKAAWHALSKNLLKGRHKPHEPASPFRQKSMALALDNK